MQFNYYRIILITGSVAVAAGLAGCGAQGVGTNVNLANTSTNTVNTMVNVNANTNSAASSVAVETKEPEQYQAKVTLKLEALGAQQTTALPTLSASVARNAVDRRMEFTMPAGVRIVYLDIAGTN